MPLRSCLSTTPNSRNTKRQKLASDLIGGSVLLFVATEVAAACNTMPAEHLFKLDCLFARF